MSRLVKNDAPPRALHELQGLSRETLLERTADLPDRTVGPFVLEDFLGEGGMGAVYRAHREDSGESVALKLFPLRRLSDPVSRERVRQEALVGLSLKHPHLVQTLVTGEAGGWLYLALELAEGGDLEDRLAHCGCMEERETLGIMRAVASALAYLNRRGVIHRDIKPANIMFGADGRVQLSDLGLIKIVGAGDPHLTSTGLTLGTPYYIAPEQARGELDLDIRADLYALGATAYQMLTGQVPFDGPDSLSIMARHCTETAPAVHEINPEVSPWCASIVHKLLSRDRRARYASPELLIDDIDRLLAGQKPLAASCWRKRLRATIARLPDLRGGRTPRASTRLIRAAGVSTVKLRARRRLGTHARLEGKRAVSRKAPGWAAHPQALRCAQAGVALALLGLSLLLLRQRAETLVPVDRPEAAEPVRYEPPTRLEPLPVEGGGVDAGMPQCGPLAKQADSPRERYALRRLNELELKVRLLGSSHPEVRANYEHFLRTYGSTLAGSIAQARLERWPGAPVGLPGSPETGNEALTISCAFEAAP
ncbi:MAG: serine/threonine protein kinase [Planctomycetes bacterium]|nr:serine/threonine protein kinase [Planctomycetota bacterium]